VIDRLFLDSRFTDLVAPKAQKKKEEKSTKKLFELLGMIATSPSVD